MQVSTCPECEGVGETSTPCGTCGGDGRVRKSKRISLTVPAGGPPCLLSSYSGSPDTQAALSIRTVPGPRWTGSFPPFCLHPTCEVVCILSRCLTRPIAARAAASCAGVDDGSRLRVRGEGNAGRRGGEPGDLYVFIGVRPHPKGLRREGTTVHSDIDISYIDAILGTSVQARGCAAGLAASAAAHDLLTGSRVFLRSWGTALSCGFNGTRTCDMMSAEGKLHTQRCKSTNNASGACAVVQLLRQCELQVATVDGMVDLKIPSGTQPGTTLVMAKRGVPRLGSSTVRGDHQVRHSVAAARACLCFCSQCKDIFCGQAH